MNLDGAVDESDVEKFFDYFSTGNANADVNQNGGVEGDDFECFSGCWGGGLGG